MATVSVAAGAASAADDAASRPPTKDDALSVVAARVQQVMAGWDASHDGAHVARVRALARRVAAGEGVTDARQLLLVELAALLHDVDDAKYVKAGAPDGPHANSISIMRAAGVDADMHNDVCAVIDGVSFQKEAAASAETSRVAPPAHVTAAAAIVQDADRLDAMGALGIARCIAFGTARGRPIVSAEDRDDAANAALLAAPLADAARSHRHQTSVGHMYAKLLRLQGLLKTETGRKLGAPRHAAMLAFLDQIHAELRDCDE